jgi:hypothetical protein
MCEVIYYVSACCPITSWTAAAIDTYTQRHKIIIQHNTKTNARWRVIIKSKVFPPVRWIFVAAREGWCNSDSPVNHFYEWNDRGAAHRGKTLIRTLCRPFGPVSTHAMIISSPRSRLYSPPLDSVCWYSFLLSFQLHWRTYWCLCWVTYGHPDQYPSDASYIVGNQIPNYNGNFTKSLFINLVSCKYLVAEAFTLFY